MKEAESRVGLSDLDECGHKSQKMLKHLRVGGKKRIKLNLTIMLLWVREKCNKICLYLEFLEGKKCEKKQSRILYWRDFDRLYSMSNRNKEVKHRLPDRIKVTSEK